MTYKSDRPGQVDSCSLLSYIFNCQFVWCPGWYAVKTMTVQWVLCILSCLVILIFVANITTILNYRGISVIWDEIMFSKLWMCILSKTNMGDY